MSRQFSSIDQRHMARAIELAARGRGSVEPNPLVGCVIARGADVVAEGWHARFGGPHAEVVALGEAGQDLAGTTMYVTLEPCCHQGKTPPCTEAILRARIPRVVVASEDPSPAARGQGIRQLTDAGLVVETGLLAGESQALNAPYQKLILQRRPWVLAKWAMTLDGKLATRTGDSQWISNAASRRIVHQLRGRMDAILVGRGTVQRDDPRLTARPPGPRQAARVVLDSKAGLELHSRLVRTAREVPVIVAVGERAPLDRRSQLEQAGCEIMICQGDESRPSLANLLDQLGQRRLTNVMVEGGSQLLGAFFDARLIDEVHVFIATRLAGGAAALTPLGAVGIPKIADAVPLANLQVVELQDDVYIQGRTLWS